MKPKQILTLVCLVVLTAAAAVQAAGDQIVFIVRHAERADAGTRGGGTMSEDPPLSTAGKARAQRLATMLGAADVQQIFTTTFQRTRQTAAPLATARHLEIDTAASSTADGLVERLRKSEGASLVVGHSNTIPEILTKLGVAETITIPEQEFNNLFIVVLRASGPPMLIKMKY
jgi:broad specificity phosphatase PhoE